MSVRKLKEYRLFRRNVFIPRFLGSKLPCFHPKVQFSSNCTTLFSFQFLMFKTIITLLSSQVLEFKVLNLCMGYSLTGPWVKQTTHGGTKSFKCTVCDAIFARNTNLSGHMASIHEGKKPFKCNNCDASSWRNKAFQVWHL